MIRPSEQLIRYMIRRETLDTALAQGNGDLLRDVSVRVVALAERRRTLSENIREAVAKPSVNGGKLPEYICNLSNTYLEPADVEEMKQLCRVHAAFITLRQQFRKYKAVTEKFEQTRKGRKPKLGNEGLPLYLDDRRLILSRSKGPKIHKDTLSNCALLLLPRRSKSTTWLLKTTPTRLIRKMFPSSQSLWKRCKPKTTKTYFGMIWSLTLKRQIGVGTKIAVKVRASVFDGSHKFANGW